MVINVLGESRSTTQLSDLIFTSNSYSFSNIAALPSNVEAVDASLMFASGLSPFVALAGPSGCGKSHLLHAAAAYMNQYADLPAEVMTVEEFLTTQSRHDTARPLILDDAQVVLNRPRYRILFRLALERRVKSNRPTLLALTADKSVRPLGVMLPTVRKWILAEIARPSAAERVLLVNQIARNEDVRLSSTLVNILAAKLKGNGRTFQGALRRLKLESHDWSDRHRALRACGVLDPFFSDNSEWDLRHRIYREAERNRLLFPGVRPETMACFAMLHEAKLNEEPVARYLNCEPSEAYLLASRFDRQRRLEPELQYQVNQFIDCVIDAIAR